MSFRGFTINMYFEKTPGNFYYCTKKIAIVIVLLHSTGGERWYVNNVELTYSTSNSLFEHIDRPNLNVKLSTPPHTFLFPTPIGKSFECMTEQTIVMFAQVIQSTKLLLNHFCLIKYFRRRKLIKNTFMSRKFFLH